MSSDKEWLRRVAFGVGYRMLGSVADAEDVAQEAIERLLNSGTEPDSPEAWITTVATRLSIDVLRSARTRRERYTGDWLPEPMIGRFAPDDPPDASDHVELADDLSLAFLVLLERLSPTERAAFLLHDVLDYSYEEIARILARPSQGAVRQLVSRARAHVSERKPRFSASAREQTELVSRFLAACQSGAVDQFISLLTEDVVFTGDGGGKVPPGFAISQPVNGRESVAKLLASFIRRTTIPAHLEPASVNGDPGMLIMVDLPDVGGLLGVWSFELRGQRIAHIRGVINPDKLQHLAPLVDLEGLAAVLGSASR